MKILRIGIADPAEFKELTLRVARGELKGAKIPKQNYISLEAMVYKITKYPERFLNEASKKLEDPNTNRDALIEECISTIARLADAYAHDKWNDAINDAIIELRKLKP